MVGRHVVLGIRPEHFHLRPNFGGAENSSTEAGPAGSSLAKIDVTMHVIEPLGNDMDVYMSSNLHEHIVGRVEAEPGLKMNSAATVFVDARKVHVFEPGETGMNLSQTREPTHALA